MDFLQLLQERYTCKHYDPAKKVSREALTKILEAGRLSPSAVNLQPWRFIVIERPEDKAKLEPGIMQTNKLRFADVPTVVLICAPITNPNSDVEQVLNKEEADGRFPDLAAKDAQRAGRCHFRDLHLHDALTWNAKQCYIAMTSMLYAAWSLGVDSTPVEGFESAKVNAAFNLPQQGLSCELIVFLGHRKEDDSNQLKFRPKSRLAFEDVVTYL
ncbi:MAG: nitroreductase family protein [Candidatus Anaerobiospirillum merdipullorum]|uniref:Nitroreductase family protein n=1 Tax=Candidatus Anaerobiospirillum merdipullorum TaxID=2838450 RepID=A0A9E2NRZ7_9GAMM|nr:nitroreductase family protein [Candidatus Anaerobiospirillum merdipullorum]